MLNSCDFAGRLVEDPKIFRGDVSRCCFTLAVDRDTPNKDGEYTSDYFDFIAWRDTADFVYRSFRKGDLLTIQNATAKARSYEDSEGKKRRKVEFEVDRAYCVQRPRTKDVSEFSTDEKQKELT